MIFMFVVKNKICSVMYIKDNYTSSKQNVDSKF